MTSALDFAERENLLDPDAIARRLSPSDPRRRCQRSRSDPPDSELSPQQGKFRGGDDAGERQNSRDNLGNAKNGITKRSNWEFWLSARRPEGQGKILFAPGTPPALFQRERQQGCPRLQKGAGRGARVAPLRPVRAGTSLRTIQRFRACVISRRPQVHTGRSAGRSTNR